MTPIEAAARLAQQTEGAGAHRLAIMAGVIAALPTHTKITTMNITWHMLCGELVPNLELKAE